MSVSQKTAARVSDAVSKSDQTAAVMDFCVGKERNSRSSSGNGYEIQIPFPGF